MGNSFFWRRRKTTSAIALLPAKKQAKEEIQLLKDVVHFSDAEMFLDPEMFRVLDCPDVLEPSSQASLRSPDRRQRLAHATRTTNIPTFGSFPWGDHVPQMSILWGQVQDLVAFYIKDFVFNWLNYFLVYMWSRAVSHSFACSQWNFYFWAVKRRRNLIRLEKLFSYLTLVNARAYALNPPSD